MQPQLKIVKTFWQNNSIQISLVVVDLGLGQEYPHNFVCVFPKNLFRKNQKGNLRNSQFSHIFGEKAYEKARELLEDALKRETELEMKEEIEAILKDVRHASDALRSEDEKKRYQ